MKWVTRAGVHIDRAASAWLIRRFIGPHAQFRFVNEPESLVQDCIASTCAAWSSATTARTSSARPSELLRRDGSAD